MATASKLFTFTFTFTADRNHTGRCVILPSSTANSLRCNGVSWGPGVTICKEKIFTRYGMAGCMHAPAAAVAEAPAPRLRSAAAASASAAAAALVAASSTSAACGSGGSVNSWAVPLRAATPSYTHVCLEDQSTHVCIPPSSFVVYSWSC